MPDIRYTKDHEWVSLDGAVATVGITDHAQQALGDIVFVDLPDPGRDVEPGDAVAVVESVKAASEVYAPLAGRITEANGALADDPALVNRSPAEEGWFYRMEVADPASFQNLLDEPAYNALVEAL